MPDPVMPDLPMVENQNPTINLGPDQFHFDPVEAANQSAGIAPQPLHDPEFANHPDRETLRSVLNDRANLGGKLPQAVNDSKTDENPQDFRDMAANMKALQSFTGKDPSDISSNYEQEKQNFVKTQGWDMPNSEGAFNSQLRDYFNTKDAREQALDDLHSRAILDASKAPSATDALQTSWQEWSTQHASALTGVPEAEAFDAWKKGYWNNLQQLQGEHHDLAQSIVDLYGNLPMGQQEAKDAKNQLSLSVESAKAPIGFAGDQPALKAQQAEDQQKEELITKLQSLPPEERQKVYHRAAALEKAKNPDNFGMATSLYSMGQAAGRSMDWLSPSAPDVSTPRGRVALELQHAARDIVNPLPYSEVNALDATKTGLPIIGTKVGQGLAGAVPTIGAFALTGEYGGLAYMLAQTTLENRDRLLINNPSMTPKEALSFGYLMAVPVVALQSITFMGLKGAFPSLEKTLADWGAGKMFFANTAVGSAAFSVSEIASNLADSAIHALNAEWNPDASVKKGLKETLLNAPQDFAMAAAFALLHIGHKPDTETGKKQADQAMADVQKPGAPKMVTTADGSKVIIAPDEKGQPKEVFKTKDPEVAASALEIVHNEQKRKEADKGNEWTTSTNDANDAANGLLSELSAADTTGAQQAASDQLKAEDESKEPKNQEDSPASRLIPDDYPISYMNPRDLKLSQDVPNFKENADLSTGVVEGEQLQGKLDLKGMGPLLVWERLNGDKEIISGRHRLDLARRTEAPLVPVQILKESEGHTAQQMSALDAEQNIKDEKGTVKDYANYFRNNGTSREEAEAGGLLSRIKGRSGFSIGRMASDDLYALFSAGKISEAKAAAIAQSAPNDAGLQQAAMRRAGDLKAEEIPGYIALIKRETSAGGAEQIGLFGDDESFIKEAERLSKAAASRARELTEQIAAVQGAAKRPEAAAKLGVDVKDPHGLENKIAELKDQRTRFSQFWLHNDLMQQLGAKPSVPTIDANGESNLFHEKEMPFNLSGEEELNQEPQQEQRNYKEDDQTGYFVMEGPELQAYLDLAHVPEEKREQAQAAFKQASEASTAPYPRSEVPASRGVDRDELRQVREEQAAAYRGLLKGDAEAVKNAIENGVPLSKLIAAYAKGEVTPFSIQGAIINSPADLAAHNLAHRTPFFESLKVAVLDNSNQVIHSELISIGSLNESIAHPREIMRAVERGKQVGSDLGRKIKGWMLMHNHPSGDPTPSEADRRLTRRLDEVAGMMESPLLDHVITNGETYFSFNQAGINGRGVSGDSKLKPKLQTIPKPEDLKEGTMADWEAIPAGEAPRIERAAIVQAIRATLQTADPGMIHVLNLNTRHGLISVDRHPLDVSPGEILKQSSKHGTYAIALSFPDTSPEGVPMDTQGATAAWRPFVRKMTEAGTLYQLPLVDAVTKEFSWRESGLLEEPGKYGSDNSVNEEKTYFQAARPEEKPEPPTLKDRMLQTASRIKDSINDLPKDNHFRRSLLAWSGRNQRSTLEITRAMKEIDTRVPDSQEREAITNFIEAGGSEKLLQHWADGSQNPDSKAAYERALNLSPEARAIAEKVSETFRILEARGEKWGIDMGHREGYVPHIYKQGDPAPPLGSNPKRLSEFFKFSQERVFNNYFDAEQNGYDAQTKDIGKLLGLYLDDMNSAINSRRFVAEMHQGKADDGRNLLSARGSGQTVGKEEGNTVHLVYPDKAEEGTQDYQKINQPALHDWVFAGKDSDGNMILVKGDLDVHPDVADHLNNVLSTSGVSKWLRDRSGSPFSNALKSTVQGLITAQSYAKGTGLSFSPFHQVQEGIHAIGHQINPLHVPVIDGKNPEQLDAAAHGLMIAHDRISQNQFQEGLGHGGKNLITLGLRKLGWGFSEAAADKVDGYNDWLFGKYIPGLKFKTYQHILERNMERFASELESGQASEWQIKNLSAQQANAAYGHLNYAEIGRNPTLQHIFQLVALAPDFLEARAKFVAQAGKGLIGGAAKVATNGKQGSKVGYEQLSAIALLAATQVIGGRIANKLINDEWDMEHPFEIRVGNTYYGFRSVPEDIFKLATDWRAFVGGRISPLFGKFIQEGLFGQNYRHEKTSISDAISDIFSGMVPGPFMAFARYLTEQAPAPVQKAIKDLPGTARNNSISPLEQILSSTGLQVHRFSPINNVYPIADKWIKANYPELRDGKSTFPVSKFQQLRYALEDNDTQKAQREVENLKAAGFSDEKINKGFKLSMTHPWTGSKELDQEFYKAQDDDSKRVIDAGNERRKAILERFQNLLR